MHLRHSQLRSVAMTAVKNEKIARALRDELFEVLGAPIMVSQSPAVVFRATNEHLDTLAGTGRTPSPRLFRTAVLLEASRHDSPAARKIAARLLPERLLSRLASDSNPSVRLAALRRLPTRFLSEALSRYPSDDSIRIELKARRLAEAGLKQPKIVDEPFDMYGDGPMGHQPPAQEDLSDFWYDKMAHDLCKRYGTNIEGQWEEVAAKVHADAPKSFGFVIDRGKLLKAIYDCIAEHEAAVLGESYIPAIPTEPNDLEKLVEVSMTPVQYIENFESLFSVKKSQVPPGIRKYQLGESRAVTTHFPIVASVPGGRITALVERAVDGYVQRWNDRQRTAGEPFRVSWSPHFREGHVGFQLELK